MLLQMVLFGSFLWLSNASWASLVAQRLKRLPGMQETRVWSLGWEDPLEKEMAAHSSTLAWRIPWMEQHGRLQSMGSQRVGHDWATSLLLSTFMHWRRKWQPTPVFLPGESQGRESLVGCHLWGHKRVRHDWSDLAVAVASTLARIIPWTRSLAGYSSWGHKESDMIEYNNLKVSYLIQVSLSFLLHAILEIQLVANTEKLLNFQSFPIQEGVIIFQMWNDVLDLS